MSKLIGRLLVVLAFGWAGSASAALIAPVTVDGREWLQPKDFLDLRSLNVADACDRNTGNCNGSLNGNDVTGWTWASHDDVNALFNYFLSGSGVVMGPGPSFHSFDEIASPVLQSFFSFFALTLDFPESPSGVRRGVLGLTREYDPSSYFYPYGYGEALFTVEPNNRHFTTRYGDAETIGFAGFQGVWLFRPVVAVPNPATLPLLALGLAALGYSRRKRITC